MFSPCFWAKGALSGHAVFFCFFSLAQLSDWTISWVHRERGWGREGGQPSSTLPPTRFHLKKCNANSVPKRHCSLRSVEGLNFAPMEWINPFDELRVRGLPLKSVFYLLVGCASAAWCCLMALLSMVKQVISYLFMLEPIPGGHKKKILHISLLDSLQLYWIWQNVQRWLNPPARFWWLHLCWFQPHSCCHLHQCGSLFYSFMHHIDCCLVFWLGALLPHALSISFFFFFLSISLSKNQPASRKECQEPSCALVVRKLHTCFCGSAGAHDGEARGISKAGTSEPAGCVFPLDSRRPTCLCISAALKWLLPCRSLCA